MGMKMKARCCDNSPNFFDEHLVREQRAMDHSSSGNSVPLFVGIDYSDGLVQLCALDAGGNVRVNRPCRNDWRELVKAVEGKGVVRRAAIEACGGAADLAEELVARAGWHTELGHPHYVAKLKGSPDKTDFCDARLLADLTRVGYLPRTWLAPAYIRDLRQLVGYRQQLVDQRRAMKLRVGALLREHRVRPPKELPSRSRWSKAWVAFARRTGQLSEHARWVVNQTLDQVGELDARVAAAEARLRGATAGDAAVQKLLTQEGVGEVTAWVLRAFVGEFGRFDNGKRLARYCGLSPKNASSGARQADGGLIKSSNRILRATVVQAAHRLIRTSPRWSKLADSMRSRGKPACVIAAAVGNRWVRRMFHEMKDVPWSNEKKETKAAG
jgi:transposase